MLKLILFLILPVFTFSCGNNGNAGFGSNTLKDTTVNWKELLSGQGCGIPDESQVICLTQAEFDKTWQAAFNDYPGQYEKPVIDFSKNLVVHCFLGNVRSGGYSVAIKNIKVNAGIIKIVIEKTEPGPGCMNASVIETPFTIVSVEKMGNLKIEFIKEVKINKCD
jgi:hypothetical protein